MAGVQMASMHLGRLIGNKLTVHAIFHAFIGNKLSTFFVEIIDSSR
jgi:hypothetical protein